MGKNQVITVKDAVHQMQLALLEGIKDQNQLFAAGSLMCKGDYQDVVTERTIGNMCGYPLCSNSLPSERPWKGRYRISLKEHKVYDLQETYLYCSTDCVINSGTFAGSLPPERCSDFDISRINEILSLFESQGLDLVNGAMERDGDLGFSKLNIQEKTETKGANISLEDWIAGPSNAIEGYIPKRDRNFTSSNSQTYIKGSESNPAKLQMADGVGGVTADDREFESAVFTEDICAASKSLPGKLAESFELLPYERTKGLPCKTEFSYTVLTEDKYGGSGKPLQSKECIGDLQLNKSKQGHKSKRSNLKKDNDTNFFNMDFMSTIITQDEYSSSKSPYGRNNVEEICKEPNGISILKNGGDRSLALDKSSASTTLNPTKNLQKHASSNGKAELSKSTFYSDQSHEVAEGSYRASAAVTHSGEEVEASKLATKSSLKSSSSKKSGQKVRWADENKIGTDSGDLCEFNEPSNAEEASGKLKSADTRENDSSRLASANAIASAMSQAAEAVALGQTNVANAGLEAGIVVLPQPDVPESSKLAIRSSLKSSGSKKRGQKVTWTNENKIETDGGDVCEFNEPSNTKGASGTLRSADAGENDSSRLASANAVASAMSQAAEAVASGQSDVADAVLEAGIVVLPQPDVPEMEGSGEIDDVESEQDSVKWSKKSHESSSDVLDTDDSWFDSPPEGFSLILSPFATMWDALFAWTTCSSLAYIYGKDDSLHEEYLFVNGREYPRKKFLPDGRSAEIQQTIDGCLARALPGVIFHLNLAIPVSVIQKGLGRLLETMSFMDALPPFRMKQWQVIVLIFLEALSVHRLPGLAPCLTTRRSSKLLDDAQISLVEYEILKEIVQPLGLEFVNL